MAKRKSLDDLRNELSAKEAELEKAKKKLEQVEHKMNRMQNKIKTESKKQRDARTYSLCFKAGHLEYVFPVIKDSGKTKFVQFIDGLAALPTVKEYAANFSYQPIEEVAE